MTERMQDPLDAWKRRQAQTLDELRAETPADGVLTGLATINAASFLELDAVIDPADTRRVVARALAVTRVP